MGITATFVGLGYGAYEEQKDINDKVNANLLAQQEANEQSQLFQANQAKYNNAIARAEKARELRIARANVEATSATTGGGGVGTPASSPVQGAKAALTAAGSRFNTSVTSAEIFGEAISQANLEAAKYGTQANIESRASNPWQTAFNLYAGSAPFIFG